MEKIKLSKKLLLISCLVVVLVLITNCTTKPTPEQKTMNAMDKFFECLGDSSKCKDIMTEEQKKSFEKQLEESNDAFGDEPVIKEQ